MNKPFTVAAVVIFAIVAVMHLLRMVLGWDATIAGTEIPMWVSIAALVIAGDLAIDLAREHVVRHSSSSLSRLFVLRPWNTWLSTHLASVAGRI